MLSGITLTDIVDVFTVDSPKGRFEQIRCRFCYGISFCYGGRITYHKDGRAVVSDRDHVVLLPKGQDYSLDCDASGLFPVINVEFAPDFCITEPTAFPIRQPEGYLRDYERLRELFLLGGNRARCISIVYDMLGRIADEHITGNRVILAATRCIEARYADAALTNAAIADAAGVSEVYLRRLFKAAFRTTPKQYVLDLRLRRARQLLAEGHGSVRDIAEGCGFSSVYHFSRAFHSAVGCSPTDYARNARKRMN